jgi:hypothetical protein
MLSHFSFEGTAFSWRISQLERAGQGATETIRAAARGLLPSSKGDFSEAHRDE